MSLGRGLEKKNRIRGIDDGNFFSCLKPSSLNTLASRYLGEFCGQFSDTVDISGTARRWRRVSPPLNQNPLLQKGMRIRHQGGGSSLI